MYFVVVLRVWGEASCKDSNVQFKTVHLSNLNLIKNVEVTDVFLTQKKFFSSSFSLASYKQEINPQAPFAETANENEQFKETTTLISNSIL